MHSAEVRQALRARRQSLGLKQEALAARMNVSGSTITQMERTKNGIQLETLHEWARMLGMEVVITLREVGSCIR